MLHITVVVFVLFATYQKGRLFYMIIRTIAQAPLVLVVAAGVDAGAGHRAWADDEELAIQDFEISH